MKSTNDYSADDVVQMQEAQSSRDDYGLLYSLQLTF